MTHPHRQANSNLLAKLATQTVGNKIRAGGLLAVVVALFTSPAPAQPASYADGLLTIPYTALPGEQPAYFSDVTLQAQDDGSLQVLGGQENPLVAVDSVSVAVMESLPLQVSVTVTGYLSVPCVELLPAAVSADGSSFSIVLAESVLGPAESCIAVLEPFATVIDLPAENLASGAYSVSVNGVIETFQL